MPQGPTNAHARRLDHLVPARGSDLRRSVVLGLIAAFAGRHSRCYRFPKGYFHRKPPIGNEKAAEACTWAAHWHQLQLRSEYSD